MPVERLGKIDTWYDSTFPAKKTSEMCKTVYNKEINVRSDMLKHVDRLPGSERLRAMETKFDEYNAFGNLVTSIEVIKSSLAAYSTKTIVNKSFSLEDARSPLIKKAKILTFSNREKSRATAAQSCYSVRKKQ